MWVCRGDLVRAFLVRNGEVTVREITDEEWSGFVESVMGNPPTKLKSRIGEAKASGVQFVRLCLHRGSAEFAVHGSAGPQDQVIRKIHQLAEGEFLYPPSWRQ